MTARMQMRSLVPARMNEHIVRACNDNSSACVASFLVCASHVPDVDRTTTVRRDSNFQKRKTQKPHWRTPRALSASLLCAALVSAVRSARGSMAQAAGSGTPAFLPRTVSAFYGTALPRPFLLYKGGVLVKEERVAAPRLNDALLGAFASVSRHRGCAS